MFISSDDLLRIPRPHEHAPIRLVCFPPGGADAFIWDAYSAYLPDTIELCAIQLPNRGLAMEQYKSRAQITQEVVQALLTHTRQGQQLVFHGYCVGSLWAYDAAVYLRDHAGIQPIHFIGVGCMAPQQRGPQIEFMKTAGFVEIMTSFYAPGSIEYNYVLSTIPAVKHDAAMLDQDMPPLTKRFDFPITMFGSQRDQFVPDQQDLWNWQDLTRGPFHVKIFEGDHFFGLHNQELLMKSIIACIQEENVSV